MRSTNIRKALPPGLARVSHDIERLAQASIRITSHAADQTAFAIGASRLGGQPDLPAGAVWPVWQTVPMAFIAQVRLTDVRAYDTRHALPSSGTLWFFYAAQQQTFGADPADRGSWQAIYDAGDSAHLQRTPAPAALPPAAQFRPCAVTFAREITLPQRPAMLLPNLDWTSDERKQYEEFLAQYPSPADRAAAHHRLLGHPDELQDDMHLQCALMSHGISSVNDPRAAQVTQTALDWRLLLQIDSDEQAGMEWGNDGMIYYWIEQDALRARRFENAWLVLQSE